MGSSDRRGLGRSGAAIAVWLSCVAWPRENLKQRQFTRSHSSLLDVFSVVSHSHEKTAQRANHKNEWNQTSILYSIDSECYSFAYEARGMEIEAQQLQEEALKNVEGTDTMAVEIIKNNLAGTFLSQGRWKEAEELFVQVMETSRRVLGQEHPSTLTSMASLASTYWKQGHWEESKELDVQVMETRKRVLGQEHPDTLSSMANLASTFWNQGRWRGAEVLGVQVLETRKRVFGQEHPDTLTSVANLASTYQSQGRWKEAEELGVQAIETFKRVVGQEHPDTLTDRKSVV